MPQLVKRGKYVFGWSRLEKDGKIKIPQEAVKEYSFESGEIIILISGSKSSGGFGIFKLEKLQSSPLKSILHQIERSLKQKIPFNKSIRYKNRYYCWTTIKEESCINLLDETLKAYGITVPTKVLAVRGSGLGLTYLSRGPIYHKALQHPEIPEYKAL